MINRLRGVGGWVGTFPFVDRVGVVDNPWADGSSSTIDWMILLINYIYNAGPAREASQVVHD